MPNNNPNKEDTPLIKAVNNNDKEEVERLIKNGADVNESGDYCYTPLMWAVQLDPIDVSEKDLDAIRNLCDHIADVNAKDEDSDSSFVKALKRKLHIIRVLLEKGADINARAKDNPDDKTTIDTPLMLVMRGSRCDTPAQFREVREFSYLCIIKLLVSHDADVNVHGLFNDTPLICAAMNGSSEIVKFLLEKGADVNARNDRHNAPLAYAITNGNPKMVKLLLDYGADAKARYEAEDASEFKDTPLILAAGCGNLKIVELIFARVSKTELEEANDNGDTPLMIAAENGNLEIVKYLIEKGANVNAKNDYGRTALDLAGVNGHTAVAEFLCEHGAKKGCDL